MIALGVFGLARSRRVGHTARGQATGDAVESPPCATPGQMSSSALTVPRLAFAADTTTAPTYAASEAGSTRGGFAVSSVRCCASAHAIPRARSPATDQQFRSGRGVSRVPALVQSRSAEDRLRLAWSFPTSRSTWHGRGDSPRRAGRRSMRREPRLLAGAGRRSGIFTNPNCATGGWKCRPKKFWTRIWMPLPATISRALGLWAGR